MEESDEVTEVLVLAELTGIIDSDFFLEDHHHANILGVDTDKPILQIDNSIFSGKYQDVKGTAAIFEEKESEGDEKELSYMCKTFKKLVLERVFLQEKTPKPAVSGDESIEATIDDRSHAASSMSSSETANDHPSFTVSSIQEENMCIDSCSVTQITDVNSVKDSSSFPVPPVKGLKSVSDGKCLTTLPSSVSNSASTSCCLDDTTVGGSKILKKKPIKFTVPVDKPPTSPKTCISDLKSVDSEKTTSGIEMSEFEEKLSTCSIKGSEGCESQIVEEMHVEYTQAAACSESVAQHISSLLESSQSQTTGAKSTSET